MLCKVITVAEKDGATIIVIEQPSPKETEIIINAKKLYTSEKIAEFKGLEKQNLQNDTERD